MNHTLGCMAILLITTALACKSTGPDMRLHDIWALQTMRQKDLPEMAKGKPYIEIHVDDKKLMGNGGCNELFGTLTFGENNKFEVSNLGSTKMACPNLPTEAEFMQLLAGAKRYELRELSLFVFGENGEELLKFKKVD